MRKTKLKNPLSLSPDPSNFTVSFSKPAARPLRRTRLVSRSRSKVRFSQEVDVWVIQEGMNDAWFKDVSKFLPATNSEEAATSEVSSDDSHFETFLKGIGTKHNPDSDEVSKVQRGFHKTDVVMIEADLVDSMFFGSGVLMQNPSTWGQVDQSARRFVLTAAHCVCDIRFDGWSSFKKKQYQDIRLRIPIKPWKNFPEDYDKYCHHSVEMNKYFSNIVVDPNHVFVHPKYKGSWGQHKW